MSTQAAGFQERDRSEFQTNRVLPVAGAHFVHDLYTAAIPAFLPVLIERLSLSLMMAGTLSAMLQVPGILNLFIGYLADRVSLRYFVIFAPAVTATLVSSLGFADSYVGVMVLMLATGVSVACFHAPAPAMIARLSGKQVGKGMSFFMAFGELARAVGPIMAVWAISMWGFGGIWRLMFFGWGATMVLSLQLRGIPTRMSRPKSLRGTLPYLRTVFLPMGMFMLFRNFLTVSLTTYLPTYMTTYGASLWLAGGALSILELAGVAGALLSGTASDYFGRRKVLMLVSLLGSLLLILFLNVQGWMVIPLLVLMGFMVLSTGPINLAIVQDQMRENRALGNGIFMVMAFALRPIALMAVGYLGDRYGLHQAFLWSALISLASLPFIMMLPENPDGRQEIRV
jgi:FSR family fosmidomycin resistance protein-like MFS transporter